MHKIITSLMAVLLLLALAGCTITDPEDATQSQDQQDPVATAPADPIVTTADPEQSDDDGEESTMLEYGDLISINDNRDSNGVVVVKAKVYPLPNGNFLVLQNYYNVIGLIQDHDFTDCEMQYWAVADIDGDEIKVISFTMPPELVAQVVDGGDMATQLEDLVEDLYVHSSLK